MDPRGVIFPHRETLGLKPSTLSLSAKVSTSVLLLTSD
jgi:hypothetical protein